MIPNLLVFLLIGYDLNPMSSIQLYYQSCKKVLEVFQNFLYNCDEQLMILMNKVLLVLHIIFQFYYVQLINVPNIK